MASFNERSKSRLSTCDHRLQTIFNEVIKHIDITILEGHRGEEAQNAAFASGNSTKEYPTGKHNKQPSEAVDVAPCPIDWENTNRFFYLAGYVDAVAEQVGLPIRWGGDWDSDKDFSDQKFNDLVHFEVVER